MNSIKVFRLRSCDSCRKAVQALRLRGLDVALQDIRAEPVARPVLLGWLETFGDDLVNRRSATWRGLDADQRRQNAVVLLAAHPAVMKRPLVEAGGQIWLGWSAAMFDQVLDATRA